MPIISQTYCDETSFAWEHEFMPFIKMAKEDELGMNITLSNGNVVSRVLPVKIHRLDIDDQNTLEAVLDGPLRSIDFIYQEAGVNRPLKPDDDRNLNLEKTDYQNQINKVANALKDIGLSLLKESDGKITLPIPERERPVEVSKSSKKGIYIGLAIIIIALLAYWGYKQFYNLPVAEDVTIAVLAFDYQSSEDDQEWLGNGFPGAIRDVLNNVNGLQVIGKASSQSFKGKNATIKEIGEVLNANLLVEGSVSKVGKKLRITVQLTDVDTELQVWDTTYNRAWGDVYAIMDEVAQNIAKELLGELSIEELEKINVGYEVDPAAYEYYLKGINLHRDKFLNSRAHNDFIQSEKMLLKAISIDPSYADAYAELGNLYDTRSWEYNEYDWKRDSVINIAYTLNPNSPLILRAKGFGFRKPNNLNLDSAFHYYNKAYNLEPDNDQMLIAFSEFYYLIGLYENSIDFSLKAIISDPLNNFERTRYMRSCYRSGDYEETKEQLIKIMEFDPSNFYANRWSLIIALLHDKDIEAAKRIYKNIQDIRPAGINQIDAWLLAMDGKKEDALSLTRGISVYSILNMKKEALYRVDSMTLATTYMGYWTYLNLNNARTTEFIRDEPEFKEILARAKKVHEERVAKYGHLFDE